MSNATLQIANSVANLIAEGSIGQEFYTTLDGRDYDAEGLDTDKLRFYQIVDRIKLETNWGLTTYRIIIFLPADETYFAVNYTVRADNSHVSVFPDGQEMIEFQQVYRTEHVKVTVEYTTLPV